jgi:molybdopterin-guanine dinucleotide biosynthesis protein A
MSNALTTGQNPISVAVLAGGLSRRMGTDKALLRLHEDGPPLLAIVLERLQNLTDDLFIVSTPRPVYAEFGVPVVNDRYGASGPLGGIATSLSAAQHDVCLVVSCDMPFLNRELLTWMASLPQTYDALIPALNGKSRQGSSVILQTMHAFYAKSCLPSIEEALRQGQRRTTSFHPGLRIETVEEDKIRIFDPDCLSFTSINSPEDLEGARDRVLANLI